MPCAPPTRLSASRRSLALVVHHLVGAVLARERELVVGRRAGDHARAHDLAELDRRQPDAARGAQHGQRLAGLEAGAVLERVVAGAVGDGERGGALEIEIGGDLDELVGRDGGALARRVEIGVAHDPVAGPRTSVTPAPTRSTTPANSPPGENGNGGLVWYLPAMIRVSKKFRPTAATLATTSPGPATGSGMSASTRSSAEPKRWQRMAFTGGLRWLETGNSVTITGVPGVRFRRAGLQMAAVCGSGCAHSRSAGEIAFTLPDSPS